MNKFFPSSTFLFNYSARSTLLAFLLERAYKLSVLIAVSMIFLYCHIYSQESPGGSSARHIALGGGPINPYLRDVMRAHTNPAEIASDSSVVWGDLGYLATDGANGGSRYQYFGASTPVTDQFHAGLILNKRESPLYVFDSSPAMDPLGEINGLVGSILGFGAGQFGRPMSPVEVVGAYRAPSYDLGASVSYGGWKNSRTAADNLDEVDHTLRAKLGIVASDLSHSTCLDASVLLGFNSVNGSYTSSGQTSKLSMDGGTEFAIDVRIEGRLNDRWVLIPRVRWYTFGWELNETRNGTPSYPNPASDYGRDEFEIGIGEDFQTERVLIVGGMSYQRIALSTNYRTSTSQTKTTVTTEDLPKINVGIEIHVASWIVGRIGYFDRLADTKTELISSTGQTTTTISSELPWYGDPNGLSAAQQRLTLGFGLTVAGLAFDATVGEGYFLNGPWPLSGMAQQMFGVVSMNLQF